MIIPIFTRWMIFYYQDLLIDDKTENRVLLLFFHFALILHTIKGKKNEKTTQNIFDNIFQNIEYTIRELGHGDVYVNKKMKNLSRIFYDILVFLDSQDKKGTINESGIPKSL